MLLAKNQILVLHRESQRRQDLALRIDATGKAFFDAVDGKRRQASPSGKFRFRHQSVFPEFLQLVHTIRLSILSPDFKNGCQRQLFGNIHGPLILNIADDLKVLSIVRE